MTPPTLTPAERIADFVRRYLGHLPPANRRYVGGSLVFVMPAGWLVMRPLGARVVVTASMYGPDEHEFVGKYKGKAPSLIQQAAERLADLLTASHGSVDLVYPWLADPVRRELRRRAGELLTLAGSSPADVVSAAETLDEYLAARPPVPMDGGAICNALMEIGMSCRWVADPAVNAEREALQDARVALAAADDAMTREQLLNLAANLRRVLGVAP